MASPYWEPTDQGSDREDLGLVELLEETAGDLRQALLGLMNKQEE
jgi:hypothetical protein